MGLKYEYVKINAYEECVSGLLFHLEHCSWSLTAKIVHRVHNR